MFGPSATNFRLVVLVGYSGPSCFLSVGQWIIPAAAQSTDEFRPELGIYMQQGPVLRVELIDSFSANESTHDWHGDFAVYVQTALKPVFRRELRNDLDVFRNKYLTLRAGYRCQISLTSGHGGSENRGILELTSRYRLPWQLVSRAQSWGLPVYQGSALFHAVSQQIAPRARCQTWLAKLHTVRIRRDLLRYPVRSVDSQPVCPGRRVSSRSARGVGALLFTAKQRPLDFA